MSGQALRPSSICALAAVLCFPALAQSPAPVTLPPVMVQAPRAAKPRTVPVRTARVAAAPRPTVRAALRPPRAPVPAPRPVPSPGVAVAPGPSLAAAVPGLDPSAGPDTGGSLTVPSVQEQRARVLSGLGGVAFINATSFANRYTNNLPDVLKDTPGIVAQTRYGQEIRLSLRGSGIGRAFHLRGVELLQDGIPLNFADGSGDFYGVDPLSLRALEVYKGGNGLAYGASTLGGAINAVTPTAHTAFAPTIVRLEGGSFGAMRANVQLSRIEGPADALLNVTYSHQDGFRSHADQDYLQVNGNFGYRLSPEVETRFYVTKTDTQQKLPGTLDLPQALSLPRIASASAITGNQKRNVQTERIANRTTVALDTGALTVDTWFLHKSLFHPIFQVIDQDGATYGIAPRWTGSFDLGGFRNDLTVGGRAWAGDNDARQFLNLVGQPGRLTAYGRQHARNLEAYAENRFWITPELALVAGGKALHHERLFDNVFVVPARRGDRTYDGLNPKVGAIFQPSAALQVFADLTRSRDVPDFSDLAQSNLSGLTFVPLRDQKAWTAEIGTRGSWDRVRWDVTLFHAQLRDELVSFSPNGALGIPSATFNAPRTRHQGVEFGASIDLVRDVKGRGDTISLAQVWTLNDNRFRFDPVYGNNVIGGLPRHVLRTTLAYRRPDGFFIAPTLDWVPQGAFADHANTLRAPGYALLGLQAGAELARGLSVYLDARNLLDRRFISDLGPVTNARLVPSAVFYPGEGRGVFAGLRYAY